MQDYSFLWHDYETFGAQARRDRPAQFAAIRTDSELNEIGEPIMLYCQPANDFLPEPEACLITGITPQICLERGIPEYQFSAKIEQEFSQTGTIGVGYNTIRTTFGLMAGLIPRCATCAELHGWMHYLVRAMWVAAFVGAPFVLWLLGESSGFFMGCFGAALLLGASYGATRIVAAMATPKGETPYWSYTNTQGYQRMAGEGYSITKHDFRKNAYERLKLEGLAG